MSTQNTHTISQINHRVRSGGMYWKQCQITKANTWYLASEAKLGDDLFPKWLITNTNLAKLLFVSANNLASYYNIADVTHALKYATYHDDAPAQFVIDDSIPVKRTRQLMWTLAGVDFIINKSGIRIGDLIKADMRVWISAQTTIYGSTAPQNVAPAKVKLKEASIASLADASQTITEAFRYVCGVVDKLCLEVNKRKELEEELSTTRKQVNALQVRLTNLLGTREKDAGSGIQFSQDTMVGTAKAYEHKIEVIKAPKIDRGSAVAFNLSSKESLSQYIARKGKKHHRAENLTRMGLLNSDQLYSLFSDNWTDPATDKLINKDKFQDVLRDVFHLKHSNHRTPMLKAEMIRGNMAVVCQVLCKKKPNPVDDNGNKLELDNPAYLSSPDPCVRFQTRYTSKAIDYLTKNWYTLLKPESGQKVTA
jgi:hypothetical protein